METQVENRAILNFEMEVMKAYALYGADPLVITNESHIEIGFEGMDDDYNIIFVNAPLFYKRLVERRVEYFIRKVETDSLG